MAETSDQTQTSDGPSGASSSTPGGMTIQEDQAEYVVIAKMDDTYMRTTPGVLRFLQVVSVYWREYLVIQNRNHKSTN